MRKTRIRSPYIPTPGDRAVSVQSELDLARAPPRSRAQSSTVAAAQNPPEPLKSVAARNVELANQGHDLAVKMASLKSVTDPILADPRA